MRIIASVLFDKEELKVIEDGVRPWRLLEGTGADEEMLDRASKVQNRADGQVVWTDLAVGDGIRILTALVARLDEMIREKPVGQHPLVLDLEKAAALMGPVRERQKQEAERALALLQEARRRILDAGADNPPVLDDEEPG